jgi:pimeloyl-ACP methyl ester carboxylesterase
MSTMASRATMTTSLVRRRRALAASTVALVVLALSACSGGSESHSDEPTASATPGSPASSATGDGATGSLPEGFGAGPAGNGLQRFYRQPVQWNACDQGECARVWVPLDYSDPGGQAITVEMARQAASGSPKVGTLFINPGGPGASGVDFASANPLDRTLAAHYDVVGFDPRGVGRSTPIDCLSDADVDEFVAADPAPQTPEAIRGVEDEWSHYVQGCKQRSGPLLDHVSSVDVARDLDVLRALVGDDKLHYFGFSYGTYIGATYAGLFPARVGRMVLDGAVDPAAAPLRSQLLQTKGFETALAAYLQYCLNQGSCPLGTSIDEGEQTIGNLFSRIADNPLPTQSGRDLTLGLAVYGVAFPLYDDQAWPFLTQALTAALQGHGDVLLAIADAYTGRTSDGSYSDNRVEAQAPINCLDNPQDESTDEIVAGERKFEQVAPVFGRIGAWFPFACSNWPFTADAPKPDFAAAGSPPIVVIGTTRDPATPYSQAVALARELDSGVLITRDGDGHTGYGQGNTCVDSAVDAYLISGSVPRPGLTC